MKTVIFNSKGLDLNPISTGKQIATVLLVIFCITSTPIIVNSSALPTTTTVSHEVDPMCRSESLTAINSIDEPLDLTVNSSSQGEVTTANYVEFQILDAAESKPLKELIRQEVSVSEELELMEASQAIAAVSNQNSGDYTDILWNVPMDANLQHFLLEQCNENGVPPEMALALIWMESRFQPDVISRTNDYGLMQINICNHGWLREKLGIQDFLDPYDNIRAGTHMLGEYIADYGNPHLATMVYQYGKTGASRKWKQGIYSSSYSRKLMDVMNTIITTGGIE